MRRTLLFMRISSSSSSSGSISPSFYYTLLVAIEAPVQYSSIEEYHHDIYGTDLFTESLGLDEQIEQRVVIRFISMVDFTSGLQ